jgi:hypothetical protein
MTKIQIYAYNKDLDVSFQSDAINVNGLGISEGAWELLDEEHRQAYLDFYVFNGFDLSFAIQVPLSEYE